MDRDREDKLIILAVEVVEVVAPDILHVACIHKAVAVGRLLDEHHRGQVINIPVRRDLHEPSLRTMLQRFHPRLGLVLVVDLGPAVTRSQVVRLAVLVAHAVIIFDAIVEE